MNTHPSPPRRLSDLIHLASDNMDLINRDIYHPDPTNWHRPFESGGKCNVCLAGAVIAGTLGGDAEKYLSPDDFTEDWDYALQALDYAREGNYATAVEMMSLYSDAYDNYKDIIKGRLNNLPAPSCRDFETWEEVDMFLDSLDCIVDDIRNTEDNFQIC